MDSLNATATQQVTGPPIEEISTTDIGFKSVAAETVIQLFDGHQFPLPPPASSLLAVAHKHGILAAAGPQGFAVCSLSSVKQAFFAETDSKCKPYKAQLEIPVQQRISHVAFTADEANLLVVTQDDVGILVYNTSDLLQNQVQVVTNVPLPGIRLCCFFVNPSTAFNSLSAGVTYDGELLVIDLSVPDPQARVARGLLDLCITLSWSRKGKQLVAGRMDGTLVQMTPQGAYKALIPHPAHLDSRHVSAVLWLYVDVFLVAYSSVDYDPEFQSPRESYYFVYRERHTTNFTFRPTPDPVIAAMNTRLPPKQFLFRMSEYEPHIKDCVVALSTSSSDVGLFTSSTQPLNKSHPNPAAITDNFTLTTMEDDMTRAQLPLFGDVETFPVGASLDLSSRDPIDFPILNDEEIKTSGGPVPGIIVLNSSGQLCYWYIIYVDAIVQGKLYPELAAVKEQQGEQQQQQPQPQLQPQQPTSQPRFGQPAFGQPSLTSPTPYREQKFGQPAFGSPTPIGGGSSFGQPSQLGSSLPSLGTPSSALGSGGLGFAQYANMDSPFLKAAQNQNQGSQGNQGNRGGAFGSGQSFAPAPPLGSSTQNQTSGFGKPSMPAGSPLKNVSTPMEEDTNTEPTPAPMTYSGLTCSKPKPADPWSNNAQHQPSPLSNISTVSNAVGAPADTGSPMKMSGPNTPKEAAETPLPPDTTSKASNPPQDEALPSPAPSIDPSTVPLPESRDEKEEVVIPEPAPFPPAIWSLPKETKPAKRKEDAPPTKEKDAPKKTSSMMAGLAEALPTASSLPAIPEPAPAPQESKASAEAAEGTNVPLPPPGSDEDSDGEANAPKSSAVEVEQPEDDAASEASDAEGAAKKDGKKNQKPKNEVKKESKPLSTSPTLPPSESVETPRATSPDRPATSGSASKAAQKEASAEKDLPETGDAKKAAEEDDGELVLEPAPQPEPEEESEDEVDEHEFIREKLAAPLEPASTLDPFVNSQNYGGRIHKLAVQRKIELLYRDATSMIDTAGINSRSMASYLLYQNTEKTIDTDTWLQKLQSENSRDLLDEKLLLSDAGKLHAGVSALSNKLKTSRKDQLGNLLRQIQRLLAKDLVTLRGQCINLRQTIDAHTEAGADATAPLSPEQTSLQSDLRKAFMTLNTSVANLERELVNMRAKLADVAGSHIHEKLRPTTDAVASTLITMTNMVQEKTAAIDELEVQMRNLGISVNAEANDSAVPLNASFRRSTNEVPVAPRNDGEGLRALRAGYAGSATGVLSALTEEEIEHLRSKAAPRKRVMEQLRQSVEGRGVETRRIGA
ncbi:hypothetical protein KEM56_001488 [Ascosphaera pollenicola]|nr:hypothetical protein KEM56_001488 [Ascosphaera pollenicola]